MGITDFRAILHDLGGINACLPSIYHAVRRIPYGRTGQRDPAEVFSRNVGSCSGKHILLCGLLRAAGHDAQIVTMFTHFDRGIPAHPSYPKALQELLRTGEIPDFHHYVRVRHQHDWIALDATWHDALLPYGYPVNADWSGDGDTQLAATPLRTYPDTTDLAAFKERLLATLPPSERTRRAAFFRLLTGWIADLGSQTS